MITWILRIYYRYFSAQKDFVRQLRPLLGFTPTKLFYFRLAFAHKSSNNDKDAYAPQNNERLEYLGDAVLGTIVAEYLFKKYPKADEGFLTKMRSKIVKRKSLNDIGERMHLDDMLQEFNNTRISKSMLGNAVEALVGAVYMERGYEKTKRFIIKRMLRNHVDVHELETYDDNYKSQLLEHCQKNGSQVGYRVVNRYKADKRDRFKVAVLIDGQEVAHGDDYNKKSAEQAASHRALKQLGIATTKKKSEGESDRRGRKGKRGRNRDDDSNSGDENRSSRGRGGNRQRPSRGGDRDARAKDRQRDNRSDDKSGSNRSDRNDQPSGDDGKSSGRGRSGRGSSNRSGSSDQGEDSGNNNNRSNDQRDSRSTSSSDDNRQAGRNDGNDRRNSNNRRSDDKSSGNDQRNDQRQENSNRNDNSGRNRNERNTSVPDDNSRKEDNGSNRNERNDNRRDGGNRNENKHRDDERNSDAREESSNRGSSPRSNDDYHTDARREGKNSHDRDDRNEPSSRDARSDRDRSPKQQSSNRHSDSATDGKQTSDATNPNDAPRDGEFADNPTFTRKSSAPVTKPTDDSRRENTSTTGSDKQPEKEADRPTSQSSRSDGSTSGKQPDRSFDEAETSPKERALAAKQSLAPLSDAVSDVPMKFPDAGRGQQHRSSSSNAQPKGTPLSGREDLPAKANVVLPEEGAANSSEQSAPEKKPTKRRAPRKAAAASEETSSADGDAQSAPKSRRSSSAKKKPATTKEDAADRSSLEDITPANDAGKQDKTDQPAAKKKRAPRRKAPAKPKPAAEEGKSNDQD